MYIMQRHVVVLFVEFNNLPREEIRHIYYVHTIAGGSGKWDWSLDCCAAYTEGGQTQLRLVL